MKTKKMRVDAMKLLTKIGIVLFAVLGILFIVDKPLFYLALQYLFVYLIIPVIIFAGIESVFDLRYKKSWEKKFIFVIFYLLYIVAMALIFK